MGPSERRGGCSGTAIAIFLFDGAEELDWAGPWEVLASWANLFPDDGVEVFTFALGPEAVTCANGLRVIPDRTLEEVGEPDVLIYPGGAGTRAHLGDERIRAWLRGLAERGVLVTSVCTGALVLADAGLLDGRPATTHWENLAELEELGAGIDVRPDERFVDDGDIITAQGVSAGIDMALHLIARLRSIERAREVRRYIQYDPAPPV